MSEEVKKCSNCYHYDGCEVWHPETGTSKSENVSIGSRCRSYENKEWAEEQITKATEGGTPGG
jgi:hypothetical protein